MSKSKVLVKRSDREVVDALWDDEEAKKNGVFVLTWKDDVWHIDIDRDMLREFLWARVHVPRRVVLDKSGPVTQPKVRV